jgi:hypothetical protein
MRRSAPAKKPRTSRNTRTRNTGGHLQRPAPTAAPTAPKALLTSARAHTHAHTNTCAPHTAPPTRLCQTASAESGSGRAHPPRLRWRRPAEPSHAGGPSPPRYRRPRSRSGACRRSRRRFIRGSSTLSRPCITSPNTTGAPAAAPPSAGAHAFTSAPAASSAAMTLIGPPHAARHSGVSPSAH